MIGPGCPKLSIVLTCFHEGDLVAASVSTLREFMSASKFDFEIIVVVDGRDEADRALQGLRRAGITVLYNGENLGRGASVARGLKAATGEIAGFIDPDLEIHPMVIPAMALELRKGCDMVLADRVYSLDRQNWLRWALSRSYNRLARLVLGIPPLDTESGCKFFWRSKVIPFLDEVRNPRWFWDTELVVRALERDLVIRQLPVPLARRRESSTVRLFATIKEYLVELFRLRRELRAGGRARRAL